MSAARTTSPTIVHLPTIRQRGADIAEDFEGLVRAEDALNLRITRAAIS
jgi:hypothetical protein